MVLQIGMRVRIKDSFADYKHDAGKIKTITKHLPDFGKLKAFSLDDDEGIWRIEDFMECVDYPNLSME